jgi:hypothetical protein
MALGVDKSKIVFFGIFSKTLAKRRNFVFECGPIFLNATYFESRPRKPFIPTPLGCQLAYLATLPTIA